MRESGKRGKLGAEPVAMGTFALYAKNNLPRPPRSFDYSSRVAQYPIALNDIYNNSALAGVIHILQLAYAEVNEHYQYPGDEIVKETYFHLTDGSDAGMVERQVLDVWMKEGLFGTRISAYAPVNIKSRLELATAIYLFGSVYLGVEMPFSAETQFESNQPWHLTGQDEPAGGGHCVVATGANRLGLDIITWGSVESMTWDWWDKYGSEAWVVIPEIFTETDHGPVWNIDLLSLQRDLHDLDL